MRKIGICLGAFRRADLRSAVKAIARAGFGSLEFSSYIGRNGCIKVNGVEYAERRWNELAKIFAPIKTLTLHGIGPSDASWVCGSAAEREFSMKVFKTQMRFAAALGIKAIAIHDGNGGVMRRNRDFLAASRENLKRQAAVAERYGVPFGVEDPTYGSLELMRAQVESVGSPLVGFTIDTGHVPAYIPVYHLAPGVRGLNAALARTLKVLLPRCVDMHVHDVALGHGDHACPGLGDLDWKMWARTVGQSAYFGPIQMEVSTFRNEAQLIATRRRLEALLAKNE